MGSDKKPFHEEDYRQDGCEELGPILDVLVGKSGKKTSVYVDTGCSFGIAFLKDQIKDYDIGEKINSEPVPVQMADGRLIGSDLYLSKVKICNDVREIVIASVDPKRILGLAPLEELIPLLGRNFIDNFDVVLKGKNKKIALFK